MKQNPREVSLNTKKRPVPGARLQKGNIVLNNLGLLLFLSEGKDRAQLVLNLLSANAHLSRRLAGLTQRAAATQRGQTLHAWRNLERGEWSPRAEEDLLEHVRRGAIRVEEEARFFLDHTIKAVDLGIALTDRELAAVERLIRSSMLPAREIMAYVLRVLRARQNRDFNAVDFIMHALEAERWNAEETREVLETALYDGEVREPDAGKRLSREVEEMFQLYTAPAPVTPPTEAEVSEAARTRDRDGVDVPRGEVLMDPRLLGYLSDALQGRWHRCGGGYQIGVDRRRDPHMGNDEVDH